MTISFLSMLEVKDDYPDSDLVPHDGKDWEWQQRGFCARHHGSALRHLRQLLLENVLRDGITRGGLI